MPDGQPQSRFRVIGIRADGSRTVLDSDLSWDEAKFLMEAIDEAKIFAGLQIAPDTDAQ